jgi:hypothetical protein
MPPRRKKKPASPPVTAAEFTAALENRILKMWETIDAKNDQQDSRMAQLERDLQSRVAGDVYEATPRQPVKQREVFIISIPRHSMAQSDQEDFAIKLEKRKMDVVFLEYNQNAGAAPDITRFSV